MRKNTEHSVFDRLLQGAGLSKDRQLAELLGVSPQAISQARRKGRIPDRWILHIASRFHLSPEWLFTGQGGPHGDLLPGSVPSSPPAAALIPSVTPLRRAGPINGSVNRPTSGPASGPASLETSKEAAGSNAGLTLYAAVAPPDPVTPVIDMALVPLVEASLAAGQGSLETGGEVRGYFAFRQDWLTRKGDPDRMVLMKVFGDSMEPDIRHGDMVLVDQGHTQIYGHAVYAVGVNDEIYVKQVETRPGNTLVLRSFNPRYSPIEIGLGGDLADSVRIIGRIIWWCREA